MLKIRLRRTGKKKQPTYRIVVAEARSPRDGAFVDIIGHYNPRTEPRTIVINQDRARKWLGDGAQPTDTVARILYREGLIARPAFMDRTKGAQPAAAPEPATAAPQATEAAPAPAPAAAETEPTVAEQAEAATAEA